MRSLRFSYRISSNVQNRTNQPGDSEASRYSDYMLGAGGRLQNYLYVHYSPPQSFPQQRDKKKLTSPKNTNFSPEQARRNRPTSADDERSRASGLDHQQASAEMSGFGSENEYRGGSDEGGEDGGKDDGTSDEMPSPPVIAINTSALGPGETTTVDGVTYNSRGYEVCGQLNQHSKPCQRIGRCPFHHDAKKEYYCPSSPFFPVFSFVFSPPFYIYYFC